MGKPVEPVIQTFLSPSEPLLLTNFAENPHVAYDYPDANPKPLVTLPPSPQTEQPPGSSEGRRRHGNHNPKPLVALPPSAQLPFYSEQQMGSSKGQWRPTNHQRITTGHYGGPPAQPDYIHGLNSGKVISVFILTISGTVSSCDNFCCPWHQRRDFGICSVV